ncbi:hypothetical protein CsSME_00022796 [Camellia sinensis var. sinensis]
MVRSIKSSKKAKRKNKGSKKGEGSSSSDSIPSLPAKELQCDPSAYNSLHAFHIGWPCLSFDVVCDSLGLVRTEFPHTVYCVAQKKLPGTQLEYLNFPIFQGKDENWSHQNLLLMTLIWTVIVVIVMKMMKLRMVDLLHQFCRQCKFSNPCPQIPIYVHLGQTLVMCRYGTSAFI